MLLTHLATAAFAASNPSPLVLHDCEFGEAYAYSQVECTARIENTADLPLSLRIEPEPPDPVVKPFPVEVPANASVNVRLQAQLANQSGRTFKFFLISVRGSTSPAQYLQARGFVLSALDEFQPKLDFGSVDSSDEVTKRLALSSRETADFRIERVLDKPDQLDVKILPDGRSIQASIRSDAPWGVLSGGIRVAINTPRQKEAWVAVRGEVHGPVVPNWNPVSFGVLSAGREQTVQLSELRRKDGKPLRLGAVSVEGIEGKAVAADCLPASMSCRVLRLTLEEGQPPGIAVGRIIVELPQFDRSLSVDVQGLLAQPEVPAGQEGGGQAYASPKPELIISQPEDPASPDASEGGAATGVRAVSPVRAPPPGEGPLLKWAVREEGSVHGYQVFRADSEEGPFVLLNVPTIAPHAVTDSGSTYQWRDTSARKGKTYWYYVGVVYKDGRKEKITPEMKFTEERSGR